MKTVTTSVGFQDPLGNLVLSGNLVLTLSQAAEVTSGGGLIAPKVVVLALSATTAKIASTQIYFSDELTPSGTTYHAELLDSGGNIIADFGQWSITGASADLSTMVPTSIGGALAAGVVLLNPGAVTQTISTGSLSIAGATTHNGAVTVNNSLAVVNTGVFTNTQTNEVATSLVGGSSPSSEFHTINNNNTLNVSDGFAAGITVPSGATVYQANGIAAYAASGTLAVNIVGGYFQARPLVNGHQSVWGLNSVASDIGFTGSVIVGAEIDTNCTSATSTVQGVQLNGSFTAQPSSAIGIRATKLIGTGVWTDPFLSDPGASTDRCLNIGAVGTGASSRSQSIYMQSMDAGAVGHTSTIWASLNGDIVLIPAAGRAVANIAAPHGIAEFGTDGAAQQALNVALTKGFNVSDSGAVTMNMGVDDSGPACWIQGRDFAGDSASRPIRINALGGNVLIGTATDNGQVLQVAGNQTLTGKVTNYNSLATAGNGVASVYGSTSQKNETGADASVLSFTPPAAVGSYRIRISMDVSAQNTATLGWTATWTDSNGSAQAPTNLSLFTSGTATPALTVTAATNGHYYGYIDVDTNNAGTAIVVKTTFTGTSIAYKVSATIERLI